MINKVVDIYGTDKDDFVEINRINDQNTKVFLEFNNSKKKKKSNMFLKDF